MARTIGRREFFKDSAKLGITFVIGGALGSSARADSAFASSDPRPDVAVVTGGDYGKNTIKAIETLGGMEKFVPKNSRVALLPNVQSRHPGAFTKPEIVRSVIRLCKRAGAKEVNLLSWQPLKQWDDTGLGQVAKEEGANLKLFEKDEALFQVVPIPNGLALKEARILKELFNNDLLIDMPITKDHAGNKFTGTMKNLMGLNSPGCNRTFHKEHWDTDPNDIAHLDQSIADLNKAVKPALCIVDATEIINTNGPFGPGEILKPQKVVAGVDRVAIDAYCAGLRGLKPEEIVHLKRGAELGLGIIDLNKLKIQEIKL